MIQPVSKKQMLQQNRTTIEIMISPKECRICFESDQGLPNLIEPCKCTGSLKYVHQKCLRQWILKKRHKKDQTAFCEICKEPIRYQTKTEITCNSCNKIKREISRDQETFWFLLLMCLVCLGFLFALISIIAANVFDLTTGQLIIISIICSILGIIFLILLGRMFKVFVLDQSQQITKIHSNKTFPETLPQSRSRVYPESIVGFNQ